MLPIRRHHNQKPSPSVPLPLEGGRQAWNARPLLLHLLPQGGVGAQHRGCAFCCSYAKAIPPQPPFLWKGEDKRGTRVRFCSASFRRKGAGAQHRGMRSSLQRPKSHPLIALSAHSLRYALPARAERSARGLQSEGACNTVVGQRRHARAIAQATGVSGPVPRAAASRRDTSLPRHQGAACKRSATTSVFLPTISPAPARARRIYDHGRRQGSPHRFS